MNIEEHMKLTKKQRQAHIDTTTSCISLVVTKGKNKGNYSTDQRKARQALLCYHNIEMFDGNVEKVHTCHLCSNGSTAPNGYVCTNPLHLYFGTASENNMDKPFSVRQKGGKIGGKKAAASGNHNMQQTHTCPHCGKIGKGTVMKRYHFDNCKYRKGI